MNTITHRDMDTQYYRLEFDASQQKFHLGNHTHIENTHGWVTISDKVSDDDFYLFRCYLGSYVKRHYSERTVKRMFKQFLQFRANLFHNRMSVVYDSIKTKFTVGWQDAPKWATYHAFNPDGNGFYHEIEPFTLGNHWTSEGKIKESGYKIDETVKIWMDSLYMKPHTF